MANAHLLKREPRSSQKRFVLATLLVAAAGIAAIVATFAASRVVVTQYVQTPDGKTVAAASGQTVYGSNITPGMVLQYTTSGKNEGTTATTENVEIRASIPAGTTFKRIVYGGGTYDSSTRTIRQTGGKLQPGNTYTMIFEVTVDANVAYSTTISESGNFYIGSTVISAGVVKNTVTVPVPGTPGGLRVTGTSRETVGLAWNAVGAPAPGTRIAEYIVYRGGAEVGRTATTSFTNGGLSCNTSYSYTVAARAVATQGSGTATSSGSAAVAAKTAACPPGPQVTLSANDRTGSLSITRGSALTLKWSTGSNPASCNASGSWSGAKAVGGGSENRSGDATAAKTLTYTLTCSNSSGSAASTVQVIVTNPSGGGTTTPPPGRGAVAPDTAAPSKPGNFLATAGAEGLSVTLSWEPSTDDKSGVRGYLLERSTDQSVWTKLAENLAATSFADTTAAFDTKYFYRLAAVDNAGNRSEYASNEYTTGKFEGNLSEEMNTLQSEDGLMTVLLSKSAVDEGTACGLTGEPANGDILAKYREILVAGPYSLVCKKSDGTEVSSFKSPAEVSVRLDADSKKAAKKLASYNNLQVGLLDENSEFAALDAKSDPKTGLLSFSIDKPFTAIVTGTAKKTIWPTIISILVLVLIVGGGIFLVMLRRAQKQQYEEYIRKKYLDL